MRCFKLKFFCPFLFFQTIYFLEAHMSNPLSADPECAQLTTQIVRQCSQDMNFGLTGKQVRRLRSTHRGESLWEQLVASRVVEGKKKFDLTKFCKQVCSDEFTTARKCFKNAKSDYPMVDSREVCYWEVLDLCKRIEFTWTDIMSRANS